MCTSVQLDAFYIDRCCQQKDVHYRLMYGIIMTGQ